MTQHPFQGNLIKNDEIPSPNLNRYLSGLRQSSADKHRFISIDAPKNCFYLKLVRILNVPKRTP
jgi:hypothetical protein